MLWWQFSVCLVFQTQLRWPNQTDYSSICLDFDFLSTVMMILGIGLRKWPYLFTCHVPYLNIQGTPGCILYLVHNLFIVSSLFWLFRSNLNLIICFLFLLGFNLEQMRFRGFTLRQSPFHSGLLADGCLLIYTSCMILFRRAHLMGKLFRSCTKWFLFFILF